MSADTSGEAEVMADMDNQAVLAALRMLIGEEALGRLLEASKITEREPVPTLRKAIEIYSTLLVREQAGWGVELQRGNGRELVPFPLD